MTPERRKLVAELREEGRAAFRAGKAYGSNPYLYVNRFQWWHGWLDAEHDAELATKEAGDGKE